ncbi:hypothetical protein [Alcanivorax sp.]|jgi:predicted DNA-binding transcriptional regulator AlpA|uniref:helix-turn-helix transcriptional regulator n=1 Tax=Alcanivorax sp. TaxID=1872427 RepID=UPI0032D90BC3
MQTTLPQTGYLRLYQIVGQTEITEEQAARNRARDKGPKRSRPAITPIVPVAKSTWWAGVKAGRFPPGVRLPGGQVTVWRAADIYAYIQSVERGAA